VAQVTKLGLGGYSTAARPTGPAFQDFTGVLTITPALIGALDSFGSAYAYAYTYQNYPLTMSTVTLDFGTSLGSVDLVGGLSFSPIPTGSLSNIVTLAGALSVIPALTGLLGAGTLTYNYLADLVHYPLTMIPVTLDITATPPAVGRKYGKGTYNTGAYGTLSGFAAISGQLTPSIVLFGEIEVPGAAYLEGTLTPVVTLSADLTIRLSAVWQPSEPCEPVEWVEAELCDA
jgi:hypothetical protein